MKIFTTTVLGSPAAECAHFGICQVDALPPEQWDSFQPQHFRHTKAALSLSGESGRLRFEFPFAGMRTDTRKAFFSPDGFRIDSAGHLPGHLARALGTENQIILPGLYPLVFAADGVMLEVEIRKEVPASMVADFADIKYQSWNSVTPGGPCALTNISTRRVSS